jgi:hypothetical protein
MNDEQDAWRDFMSIYSALLTKTSGGQESPQAPAPEERPTIHTLEELRTLPIHAVVLEDQYRSAYQKVGEYEFSGDGRFYDDIQVDLPCTVIYNPETR